MNDSGLLTVMRYPLFLIIDNPFLYLQHPCQQAEHVLKAGAEVMQRHVVEGRGRGAGAGGRLLRVGVRVARLVRTGRYCSPRHRYAL